MQHLIKSYKETLALIKARKQQRERDKGTAQDLKRRIKASVCPNCPYKRTCQHDISSSISFFMENFSRFHIVPKEGFYVVDGKEKYRTGQCELIILKELWASCPERCKYCDYASTDRDGDWWCSYGKGEEGGHVFHNLSLLRKCPKRPEALSHRLEQRIRRGRNGKPNTWSKHHNRKLPLVSH